MIHILSTQGNTKVPVKIPNTIVLCNSSGKSQVLKFLINKWI